MGQAVASELGDSKRVRELTHLGRAAMGWESRKVRRSNNVTETI